MTGSELEDARLQIGLAWGLKRPLNMTEMGKLLHCGGRSPGATITLWERGRNKIPGPARTAVQALIDGWRPATWQDIVTPSRRKERRP
jgi:hypothetical protein